MRLIALDGSTFNVRAGSLNHRLDQALDGVGLRFGPAGPDAAANPLDLRLRCIKVRKTLAMMTACHPENIDAVRDGGCC